MQKIQRKIMGAMILFSSFFLLLFMSVSSLFSFLWMKADHDHALADLLSGDTSRWTDPSLMARDYLTVRIEDGGMIIVPDTSHAPYISIDGAVQLYSAASRKGGVESMGSVASKENKGTIGRFAYASSTDEDGETYVFLDTSQQRSMFIRMLFSFVATSIISLLALYAASRYLARDLTAKAVKTVLKQRESWEEEMRAQEGGRADGHGDGYAHGDSEPEVVWETDELHIVSPYLMIENDLESLHHASYRFEAYPGKENGDGVAKDMSRDISADMPADPDDPSGPVFLRPVEPDINRYVVSLEEVRTDLERIQQFTRMMASPSRRDIALLMQELQTVDVSGLIMGSMLMYTGRAVESSVSLKMSTEDVHSGISLKFFPGLLRSVSSVLMATAISYCRPGHDVNIGLKKVDGGCEVRFAYTIDEEVSAKIQQLAQSYRDKGERDILDSNGLPDPGQGIAMDPVGTGPASMDPVDMAPADGVAVRDGVPDGMYAGNGLTGNAPGEGTPTEKSGRLQVQGNGNVVLLCIKQWADDSGSAIYAEQDGTEMAFVLRVTEADTDWLRQLYGKSLPYASDQGAVRIGDAAGESGIVDGREDGDGGEAHVSYSSGPYQAAG